MQVGKVRSSAGWHPDGGESDGAYVIQAVFVTSKALAKGLL